MHITSTCTHLQFIVKGCTTPNYTHLQFSEWVYILMYIHPLYTVSGLSGYTTPKYKCLLFIVSGCTTSKCTDLPFSQWVYTLMYMYTSPL